ncbi:hypothetical protein HY632_02755 [Candidatus Uhrbacteria bacterium]|nr:hypothetical protein [Candidatus Uhrbacteria bacterium]
MTTPFPRSRVIGLCMVAVVAIGLGWWAYQRRARPVPSVDVTTYAECVAAGYPVLERYPPQCRAIGGRVFTQDVGNELELRDRIQVDAPRPHAVVRGPIVVSGRARGPWYFEASFPVRLVDASGGVLATGIAQAQGEWMTEQFVPFRVELPVTVTQSMSATLILERDNPSGLPEHDAALRIPLTVAPGGAPERLVHLFYYDSTRDRDAQGNVQCSRQGLVAVARAIPRTMTPIQDALHLLLRGALTPEERIRGITTEYPLPGVALTAASLRNGMLTLTLTDPEDRTSGGSCRVGVLQMQIEATAKQFPGVREVRFHPEDLFQP